MTKQGLEYWLYLRDSNFETGMGRAARATKGLDLAVGRVIRGAAGLAAGAFAVSSLKRYGDEIINTKAKMEGYTNVMKFASKDQEDLVKNQKFLNSLITDMKLPIMESYDGYSKLLGAMRNTPLEKASKDIFRGVSTMSTVLHLDPYKQGLVNYALTQMVSKGTVSSEELKQQLGESLPGAMSLAAKAMKMPMDKFSKALEEGKIKAVDFLPAFAKILEQEFGKGLPDALNSMQAKMTEAANDKIKLKLDLGEAMQPAYLEYLELQKQGLKGAMDLVKWSYKNKEAIATMAKAAGIYAGTYLIIAQRKKAMLVLDALMLRSEMLKVGFTEARAKGLGRIKSLQEAYNVVLGRAMLLNPAFWIPAAIAGVVTLYQKWEPFNRSVHATMDQFKNLKNLAAGLHNVTSVNSKQKETGKEQLKEWFWRLRMGGSLTFAEKELGKQEEFSKSMRERLSMSSNPDELRELLELPGDFKINGKNIGWALKKAKRDYGYEGTLSQFGFMVNDKGETVKSSPGSDSNEYTTAESVGAGRQVRNVTVTINGGLIPALTIQTTNLAQSAKEIENAVKEALVRGIRDFEIALG